MTDNRTTELLRDGLTERGVKWTSKPTFSETTWAYNGLWHNAKFEPWSDSTFKVTIYDLTPEQAIAATLGAGECVMEYGGDVTEDTARVMGVYFCSECGSPNYNDCMPRHCNYCGKVVKR